MPEEFEDPEEHENLDEPPAFFPYDGQGTPHEAGSLGELIQIEIEGVFAADSGGNVSHFVLVTDGDRKLPIMIGPYEAKAISISLEGQRSDRPMTHDLLRNVIERLGGTVDRVVIDDFWNAIYYAKIYLRTGSDELEIDARPSDAIATAVRFDAPIFVSDAILDQAMEE